MTSLDDIERRLKEVQDVDLANVLAVTRNTETITVRNISRFDKFEAYVKALIQLSLENRRELKELKNAVAQLRVETKASSNGLEKESGGKTEDDGPENGLRE